MTIHWIFDPLPPLSFDVLLVDPPWTFKLRSPKGERKSAQAQYSCMSMEAIAKLPVSHLARGDCLLFLWCTWPLIDQQLKVMQAWGFRYVTGGVWRKMTKHGKVAFGTGYRVRSACEPWLLGVIGNPETKADRNIFDGTVRQHSRKPEDAYAWCETFVPGALRRAELFARESRLGWDSWGLEAGKFDVVDNQDLHDVQNHQTSHGSKLLSAPGVQVGV